MDSAKQRAHSAWHMTSVNEQIADALRALRLRAGFSMAELAKRMGYKTASGYQRWEDPKTFKGDVLPIPVARKLVDALDGKGEPPITEDEIWEAGRIGPRFRRREWSSPSRQGPMSHLTMPVVGEVQAGNWRQIDEMEEPQHRPIPVQPNPSISKKAQYALLVRGNSINLVANDGDYLVCLDVAESGRRPRDGDLVVVERSRDGGAIIELTVKRYVREFDGTIHLMPESSDKRHQMAIPLDDTDSEDVVVSVKAIVIMRFGYLNHFGTWLAPEVRRTAPPV